MSTHDTDIDVEILRLSLEVRKVFDAGDALFKEKRQLLDLDSAFDPEKYLTKKGRTSSLNTLSEYLKQLELEKQFYESTNVNFLPKLLDLVSLDEERRILYEERVLPKVLEGFLLRMNINKEKTLAVKKSIAVVNILEKGHKKLSYSEQERVEKLNAEIDEHLDNQYSLGMQQRASNLAGQSRIESMLELLKTF